MNTENRDLNLKEFKSKFAVLKSRPIKTWISFTGRCNLNCKHCPRQSLPKAPPKYSDMSLEIFNKLEKEIFPFIEKCKVGGNNLGEQLFAKEWDYFFERIEQYPFDHILVTNGLLLTKERIKKLVEKEWTIDLSIEGGTKSTYNNIRGWDFEKFIKVVDECCQQKKSIQGIKARIRFCFTAFYDNIEELIQLIEIGSQLGVDEILVTHFIPLRECHRNQSLIYHKGLANSIFEEARKLSQELGISIKLPPLFPIKKINEVDESIEDLWLQNKTNICYHPWTSVSINEKGDVMPCCISEAKMGNIMKTNFEDIWNNRKYQKLRKTVNSSTPIGTCRNCVLRGKNFTHVHCNNDRALLSIIGPTNQIDTIFFLKLILKRILDNSVWGKKMLQRMRSVTRKFNF